MFGTVARHSVQLTSLGCRATNVRTAVSLRDIRARIKSVTAISKLTKTMQLVASSKMKSATVRAENAQQIQYPTQKATSVVEANKDHGNNLVISVASDKGMCGSVNTQSARFAKSVANEDRSRFSVASVGSKAAPILAIEFPSTFVLSLKDVGKKEFTFSEILVATEQLLNTKAVGYDEVSIVFNKFKNVITYLPTEIQIPGYSILSKDINKFAGFDFDEDEQATLHDLFEFQVATTLWGAMNSNRNSEMAARMTSMDNATKNANKIVGALTVTYNRGRQAAITTELVEICSGAAAVQEGQDK
jgi:F-type H+-transporting ATPase subunit gamma